MDSILDFYFILKIQFNYGMPPICLTVGTRWYLIVVSIDNQVLCFSVSLKRIVFMRSYDGKITFRRGFKVKFFHY